MLGVLMLRGSQIRVYGSGVLIGLIEMVVGSSRRRIAGI